MTGRERNGRRARRGETAILRSILLLRSPSPWEGGSTGMNEEGREKQKGGETVPPSKRRVLGLNSKSHTSALA